MSSAVLLISERVVESSVRCGPKVLGAINEIGGKGAAGIVGAKSDFIRFPRRGMLMCGKGAEGVSFGCAELLQRQSDPGGVCSCVA